MRFGAFNHFGDSNPPLAQHFEERLHLIEAYDRAGFYGYNLTEHHNTSLGYAPSPGIFLAAVARRTTGLKFGPMVYLLPLYHPLRLVDEVWMLDQISRDRFLCGVGQGISPIEVGFYGLDFAAGTGRFRDSFEVLRIGRTEYVLTFHGKYHTSDAVPIVMKPLQRPYLELWYGASRQRASPRWPSAAPISSSRAISRWRAPSSILVNRNGQSSAATSESFR